MSSFSSSGAASEGRPDARDRLGRLLAGEQARGRLRADLSAEVLAESILDALEAGLIEAARKRASAGPAEADPLPGHAAKDVQAVQARVATCPHVHVVPEAPRSRE